MLYEKITIFSHTVAYELHKKRKRRRYCAVYKRFLMTIKAVVIRTINVIQNTRSDNGSQLLFWRHCIYSDLQLKRLAASAWRHRRTKPLCGQRKYRALPLEFVYLRVSNCYLSNAVCVGRGNWLQISNAIDTRNLCMLKEILTIVYSSLINAGYVCGVTHNCRVNAYGCLAVTDVTIKQTPECNWWLCAVWSFKRKLGAVDRADNNLNGWACSCESKVAGILVIENEAMKVFLAIFVTHNCI